MGGRYSTGPAASLELNSLGIQITARALASFPSPLLLAPPLFSFASRRFRPPTYVGMRRSRCAYAVESEQTVAVSESDGGGGVG